MTLTQSVKNLPAFENINIDDLANEISSQLTNNLPKIEKLAKDPNANSWDSFVKQIEELDDDLSKNWSILSHLNAVKNSQSIRERYNKLLPKLSNYSSKLGQNKDLYNKFLEFKKNIYKNLSHARQKIIDESILDFELSGVGLPKDEREKFKKNQEELSKLQSKFQENILDATDEWHLDIPESDINKLAGLPDSQLNIAKQKANEAGIDGYRLGLDFPCYFAVVTYCENSSLRRTLHEAFATRAANSTQHNIKYDNSENILAILKLRHEQAKLLGFKDFTQKSLAKKMAKTSQEVLDFLEDLGNKAKPFAKQEYQELLEFAKSIDNIDTLNPWDIAFYSEKLKQHKYAISDEILKPYFPYPKVLEGLFTVVNRVFGLQVKLEKDISVWHKDVQFFSIFDKNNTLRGQFYLDPFARSHKRSGAWMDDARVRRISLQGNLQTPIAYLVCNFEPPANDKPSLLTHRDVETLFHEFGHGLHHMLTKMEDSDVSGINGVPWDAVEFPSQFMENFCNESESIKLISSHYETGKPLSDELLTKLKASKNFQSGMHLVRQVQFAMFDFRLHHQFDLTKAADETFVQRILDEVREEFSVTPAAEYDKFQNSFSHIFGGGYAAGYYSYLWAEVLAEDAFSKFTADGIFNVDTGKLFMESILEQGGSEDPDKLFREFMGRAPKVDALLAHYGLQS